MKSADDLKKIYDKWQYIDNMYRGDKSDWREIHSQLWSLESKLSRMIIRKDHNLLFCDYVRRKMLSDVKDERLRLENTYGKDIYK